MHAQVTAALRRIDAHLAEYREQDRAAAGRQARIREQTTAWFAAHPCEARAISELFGFPGWDKNGPQSE